jgi:hypothetical protein
MIAFAFIFLALSIVATGALIGRAPYQQVITVACVNLVIFFTLLLMGTGHLPMWMGLLGG